MPDVNDVILEEFRQHRSDMRRDMNGIFKRLNSLEISNAQKRGADLEAKKHERKHSDKRSGIISAIVAGAVVGIGYLMK